MTAIHGLYAITDADLQPPEVLSARVAAALSGGARMIQYRDKSADGARRREQAAAIVELCRRCDALSIINDDPLLAGEVGADGVHLGRDDAAIADVRRSLGAGSLIGVSCYNRLDLARDAQAAGADYVAFGSVFPSPTKPDAVRAAPELLRQARRELNVPIVAIGGITAENAATVIAAGADAVAVITDVFAAPDVTAAAARIAALFPADTVNSP